MPVRNYDDLSCCLAVPYDCLVKKKNPLKKARGETDYVLMTP